MLAAILATQWGWTATTAFALQTSAIPAHFVLTAALAGCGPIVVASGSVQLLTATLEELSP